VRFVRIGAAIAAATWLGMVVEASSSGAPPRTTAAETSANWAGYVIRAPAASTAFTSVIATWRQPKVACASGRAASGFWVGLGGYGSKATGLLQIGADADCTATNTARYYAWYDIPPSVGVPLTLKIAPGDVLTASVSVNPARSLVLLRIGNVTTGKRYATLLPVSSPDLHSAEWIAEAPIHCKATGCQSFRLADFGSVTFMKVAAIAGGHAGTITDGRWAATPVRLVPGTRPEFFSPSFSGLGPPTSTAGAVPKRLGPHGSSFGIRWTAHSSPKSSPLTA
jgi:hypothetical protein